MKQILIVFMVLGLVTVIGATKPQHPSDRDIKLSDSQKQQTTFTLRLNNQASTKFDFVLTSTLDTSYHLSYTVNGSSLHYDYNFPAGAYDIQITPESIPSNVVYFSVQAGCSQFVEVFDPSITLHNITLNSSCNEIWTAFEYQGQ